MRQAVHTLPIKTQRRGLVDFTGDVIRWTADQRMQSGLLTLFCRHTSASLLIQENASPDVHTDLEAFFERLAPEDDALYLHDEEGPDDMPAHLRTALTQTHLAIPVAGGRPMLGTWQGVYLFEHRRRPHVREVAMHLLGE